MLGSPRLVEAHASHNHPSLDLVVATIDVVRIRLACATGLGSKVDILCSLALPLTLLAVFALPAAIREGNDTGQCSEHANPPDLPTLGFALRRINLGLRNARRAGQDE